MRVAVAGLGGGAGASTLAAVLLATWPRERVIGVEADPSGGVWAARYGLSAHPDAPSLTSLLAELRTIDPDGAGVWAHTQPLFGSDISVLCAPTVPATAAGVVTVLSKGWSEVMAALPAEADVVVDCGRWASGSAAARIFAACDVAIVVVRPEVEWLEHLAGDAALLLGHGPVGVVVRGDGAYRFEEVERFVRRCGEAVQRHGDLSVVGVVAEDPRTVRLLQGEARASLQATGRLLRGRRGVAHTLARSALVRSVVPIANAIASQAELTRSLTVAGAFDGPGSFGAAR